MFGEKNANALEVVKVILKGTITSFRYPHFVQGVQPTYEMPPPSTLYGYICACLGRFERPDMLSFGVHFTYEAKFIDLEQVQIDKFREGSSLQREFTMNVFQRELLFNPTLTLYIAPSSYLDSFRRPYYPIALGRSQDLMTCISAKQVTLQRASQAYFEHTLLPASYAPRFPRTIATTMARYIDENRQAAWENYAIIKERAFYPDENDPFRQNYTPVWIDPDAPIIEGLARGVILHNFAAEQVN